MPMEDMTFNIILVYWSEILPNIHISLIHAWIFFGTSTTVICTSAAEMFLPMFRSCSAMWHTSPDGSRG